MDSTPRVEGNGIGVGVLGKGELRGVRGGFIGKGKLDLGRGVLLLLIGKDSCQGTFAGLRWLFGGFVVYFFFVCFFAEKSCFFFYSDLFVEWNCFFFPFVA